MYVKQTENCRHFKCRVPWHLFCFLGSLHCAVVTVSNCSSSHTEALLVSWLPTSRRMNDPPLAYPTHHTQCLSHFGLSYFTSNSGHTCAVTYMRNSLLSMVEWSSITPHITWCLSIHLCIGRWLACFLFKWVILGQILESESTFGCFGYRKKEWDFGVLWASGWLWRGGHNLP